MSHWSSEAPRSGGQQARTVEPARRADAGAAAPDAPAGALATARPLRTSELAGWPGSQHAGAGGTPPAGTAKAARAGGAGGAGSGSTVQPSAPAPGAKGAPAKESAPARRAGRAEKAGAGSQAGKAGPAHKGGAHGAAAGSHGAKTAPAGAAHPGNARRASVRGRTPRSAAQSAGAARAPVSGTAETAEAGIHGAFARGGGAATTGGTEGAKALVAQINESAAGGRLTLAQVLGVGSRRLQQSVQKSQHGLLAEHAAQEQRLKGVSARLRAQVSQTLMQATAQLQSQAQAQRERVAQWHSATVQQTHQAVTSQHAQITQLGGTYAQRAHGLTDEISHNVESQISMEAQHATDIGEQRAAAAGGRFPHAAEACQKVARDLARDSASEVGKDLPALIEQIVAAGQQAAAAFQSQSEQAAGGILEQAPAFLGQAHKARDAALQGIEQAVQQGDQALASLEEHADARLGQMESQLSAGLAQNTEQQSAGLARAGEQAQRVLSQRAGKAAAASEQSVAALVAKAARLQLRPEQAAALAAQLCGQVQRAFTQAASEVQGTISGADGSLEQVQAQARGALQRAGDSGQQGLEQVAGQVGSEAQQITGGLGNQLQQVLGQLQASGLLEQLTQSLGQYAQQIRTGLEQGLVQLAQSLRTPAQAAIAEAHKPVESLAGRIDEAQSRAEEKARVRSERHGVLGWLENQFDDLCEMLSDPAFWAGLIAGLVVIGIAILIVGTGGLVGIAGVIVGVIAGVVSAGASTIVGNLSNGKPWHEGLLLNMTIGGVVGGLGGWLVPGAGAVVTKFLGIGASSFGQNVVGFFALEGFTTLTTAVMNTLSGQEWDHGLLANLGLAALFMGGFKLAENALPESGLLGAKPQSGNPSLRGAAPQNETAPPIKPDAQVETPSASKTPAKSESPTAEPNQTEGGTHKPSSVQNTEQPANKTGTTETEGPSIKVVRQDDDFYNPLNQRNPEHPYPKSSLTESGSMKPANVDGDTNVLEHIYGKSPKKDDSPYSSFMTASAESKVYGSKEIELNVSRLKADIEAGKLPGVKIYEPKQIQEMIRNDIHEISPAVDIDRALSLYDNQIELFNGYLKDLGLSNTKISKITKRIDALRNTIRDGEYLIMGEIPQDYLSDIYPTPDRKEKK